MHDDDEASDGVLKDEDDLSEYDELPIITRKINASEAKEQGRIKNSN